VQRGSQAVEIGVVGKQREVGIAAKLRCAVQYARLAPHQQTLHAIPLHRRKDFANRVRGQAILPRQDRPAITLHQAVVVLATLLIVRWLGYRLTRRAVAR
jgi:hypothetical protein